MARDQRPIQEQLIVITRASSGIGLTTAKTAVAQGGKQTHRQQRNMSPIDPEGSLDKASERGRVHGPG